MNRLLITKDGVEIDRDEIKQENRNAINAWSKAARTPREKNGKRMHRRMSDDQREEKRRRTEQRKRLRQAERDAKEQERLMRRLNYLINRTERESEEATRVKVTYRPLKRPRFLEVCPRALYRRVHPHVPKVSSRSARTAADGFRNVVLKKTSRGFGRKAPSTRPYNVGEAGKLVRYCHRLDAVEEVPGAVLTNVLWGITIEDSSFTVEQHEEMAGFFNALEEFERAAGETNVYSHLIIPMPYELGPQGRAQALKDFCAVLSVAQLPYTATLHKPDPGGNQRNFHAHVVVAFRPFSYEGPYSWSFELAKASELNSGAGLKWFRKGIEMAFNKGLKAQGSAIRYKALSEADRGIPSTGEEPKGQKKVASERALAELHGIAANILRGAASRIDGVLERLSRLDKLIQNRQRKQEKLAAEKAVEEEEKAKKRRLLEESEATAKADRESREELRRLEVGDERNEKPARPHTEGDARRKTLDASLEDFGRDRVTTQMERLYLRLLKDDPQEIAMAFSDDGLLRVAYRNPVVEDALRDLRTSTAELAWLSTLARRLNFDHAAVPGDWKYVDVAAGGLLLPFETNTFWASRYGGRKGSPQEEGGVIDHGRGREP